MAVTFYAKKGATGIPLIVTLLDENGEIDLSGFSSVDLIVTVENTDDLLFTGTMDIHNDQVAHKGEARYEWQEGARVTGESIVKGIEPRINVEHALHVLEIIEAARKSSASGMKIKLQSKFPWPMV